MTLSLPPHLEKVVRQKVESGLYPSPTAVLAEALRVLEEREQRLDEEKAGIRRALEEGLASPLEGELDIEGIIRDARGH